MSRQASENATGAGGQSPVRSGALLPRIAVRDENGEPGDLHAALEGQPFVLLALARPRSPACRQAVRRFAALEADVPRLARVLLLPSETRGEDAAELSLPGLRRYVATASGGLAPAAEDLAYVIGDAAGRVLASGEIRPNQLPQLGARLRNAFAPAKSQENAPLDRAAPVLMVPDFLSPPLCRRLIAYFDRDGGHPSGVLDLSGPTPAWHPDEAIKRRRDLLLEDRELIRELEETAAEKLLPQIRKCFHYVVTRHEPFKLACYDEGSGYFRPHRDNETSDTLHRRFAMTANLNTGDYEGGALNFPEFGSAIYRPPRGGAIVFSSSLLHEATDVTRGRRYVLIGFFYNPADGLTGSEKAG
ncbi:MAG TPA: 2OG-Fe(II) oxygenase [Gammaproteobacteria bacterium]|nr:2OG-Fe(II) oxygenase [Gammaproteobacteria bacterium]